MIFRIAICTSLLALVACDDGAREAAVPRGAEQALYRAAAVAPCERPTRRPTRDTSKESVRLDGNSYPCRLYFRETGVVLQGDSAGRWPDPGANVARDSQGGFISSIAGDNARIAVWNPDGSFARTIGRPGQGPGELPPSNFEPLIYVDGANWTYVRSSGGQWSIFTQSFESVGRVGAVAAGARSANAVFRDAWIVTSSAGRGGSHYFRVHEAKGATLARLSEVPVDGRHSTYHRSIMAADDTSFWAGPDAGDDEGYVLELWSIKGNHLARLKRTVPWFRSDGVASRATGGDVAIAPRPTLDVVNVDREGLLLVYSWVANDSWRPVPPERKRPIRTDQNVHVEVIDWRGGAVLASEVVNVAVFRERTIPRDFFPRTNLGYRYDTSGDLPVVRMVEYGLTRH